MARSLYGQLEKLADRIEDLLDKVGDLDDSDTLSPDEVVEILTELNKKVTKMLSE